MKLAYRQFWQLPPHVTLPFPGVYGIGGANQQAAMLPTNTFPSLFAQSNSFGMISSPNKVPNPENLGLQQLGQLLGMTAASNPLTAFLSGNLTGNQLSPLAISRLLGGAQSGMASQQPLMNFAENIFDSRDDEDIELESNTSETADDRASVDQDDVISNTENVITNEIWSEIVKHGAERPWKIIWYKCILDIFLYEKFNGRTKICSMKNDNSIELS